RLEHRSAGLGLTVLVLTAMLMVGPAAAAAACDAQTATGFTEPAETVEVAAGEPGILAQMLVKPGDRVSSGDTLAKLDDTLAASEVVGARTRADAKGAIAVAQAQLTQAQARLAEIDKLKGTGALRPLELLGAQSDLEIARARVQQAEDDRRSAEALLTAAEA